MNRSSRSNAHHTTAASTVKELPFAQTNLCLLQHLLCLFLGMTNEDISNLVGYQK